jgi:hypothetical protein
VNRIEHRATHLIGREVDFQGWVYGQVEPGHGGGSGNQGPLLDTIEREMGELGAFRLDTSGGPSERRVGLEQTAKERYRNRATEVIMNVERLLRASQISGLDDLTMLQISTRGLVQTEGRTEVQPKQEWRGSNGGSPDELDTLAIAATYALERGFIAVGATAAARLQSPGKTKWHDMAKKLRQRQRRGSGAVWARR